jgi:hypothetical protein
VCACAELKDDTTGELLFETISITLCVVPNPTNTPILDSHTHCSIAVFAMTASRRTIVRAALKLWHINRALTIGLFAHS